MKISVRFNHSHRSLENFVSHTIRSCAPAAPLVHRWGMVGGRQGCQSVRRLPCWRGGGGDEIFMRAE